MVTNDVANPRTRDFIRRKLNMPRYGEQFDKLVEEFFIRRQYVLNLSPEEFLEDLDNFSRSVKYFRWDYLEENWLGVQSPSRKSITFNTRFFNGFKTPEDCLKFFETFCHECDHGTQTLGNGRNRAEGYNHKLGNRTHAIYEICTQALAAKIARNRNISQYNKKEVLTGDGYAQEIFAVPLLSAAFGVKEQDFMKYGLREREKLVNKLNVNIRNKQVTEDIINRLEEQLEYIHSVYYPDNSQKRFKELSQAGKVKIASNAMNNIVNICEEIFTLRIKNMTLEFDNSQIDNLKYDYRKMNNTLLNQYNRFNDFFPDANNVFQRYRGEYSKYVSYAIQCLSRLAYSSNKRYISETPRIITALKTGNYNYLQSLDFMREQNMYPEESSRQNRTDEEHVWQDYNDFRFWDNSEIFRIISNNRIIMEQTRKKILNANRWDNIYTAEGYQKLQDLKYAFVENKKKYNVRTKEALFSILDQDGDNFDYNVYTFFTREPVSNRRGVISTGISPREAIERSFNNSDDQIFLASLISHKFIDKLFDENGHLKQLDNPKEIELQRLLYPTISKYGIAVGNVEAGKYQARFALKSILLNDNYEGISGEDNRQELAIYGKKGVYDIVSQPLIDELLSERRIIPEKRRALNQIVAVTETRHPNSCAYRIADILTDYKRNGYRVNLSTHFSTPVRELLDYHFKGQRDFEDMLGLVCDEYTLQNYNNFTIDNRLNPDIERVMNHLGPDDFREAVIDVFFKNDFSRIPDSQDREILARNPYDFIRRLSETYVRNANMIYANNNYLWSQNVSVPRVQLEDIGEMAREEFSKNGINKRMDEFFMKLKRIVKNPSINRAMKLDKKMDDDFIK